MENGVLQQGLVLMGAGMGIVYVFLYLLVLVMRGIALVVPRFNHLLPELAPKAVARSTPAAAADAAVAVAIAAAMARSRE